MRLRTGKRKKGGFRQRKRHTCRVLVVRALKGANGSSVTQYSASARRRRMDRYCEPLSEGGTKVSDPAG